MVGSLTNLKLSVLAQSSGKYSSKIGTLVLEKSGTSGREPTGVAAGNNAKMFPTVAAMILVKLDMDDELDKAPTMALSHSAIFSVTGRKMRHSFWWEK